MRLLVIFLLVCLSALGADIYPTSRRGGLPGNMWTNVGVNLGGGIPARSTIYTNMTSANTLTQINSAIASCPSNQVVSLAAGTYNFSGSQLLIQKDGVTVRGATNSVGYPTTIFTNCTVWIGDDFGPGEGWATSGTSINISSGYTEGSTSITLASSPGADFAVGEGMIIDQTFDGTLVTDSTTDTLHRPDRAYGQIVHITGISGTTINFEPPLLGSYWASGQDPEAYGWANHLQNNTSFSGIENIDIYGGSFSGYIVTGIGLADSCWFKNIRITGWGLNEYGTRMMFTTSTTIEDCWYHDATAAPNSMYALYLTYNAYADIKNNIFTNIGICMPTTSLVGSSVSYNAGLPPLPYSPSTWLVEYFFPHGGHCHHNIYEGNWLSANIYFDNIYSSNNSENGIVRNVLRGYDTGKTSNLEPINFDTHNKTNTIVGNTLGTEGIHSSYPTSIYDDGGTGNAGTIKIYNYNTASDAIPAGEAIGSDTISDSYIYSSKPGWFGTLTWPAFTPSSSLTNVNTFTNIPAGYRAYFGEWPPASAGGGGGGGGSGGTSRVTNFRGSPGRKR